MPVVAVQLGKRSFQMACAAGEEARLHDLAAKVTTRINELEGQIGAGNDVLLLAMTALMLQDEIDDLKSSGGQAANDDSKARQEKVMVETLDAISDHIEDLIKQIA